jgi:peptide/nickel transport system substrate-binding protein
MKRTSKRATLVALAGVVALAASACGAGDKTATSANGGTAAKGGTLYYLTSRSAEHLDPQRTYIGRDIADEARLLYRTLTTFPVASGKDSLKLVADLATDTGTAQDNGKTWKFTLKDGVKWQDGKDITCEDFKYGISRTFAVDTITGGPDYAIQLLDIPDDPKGGSIYKGPYAKDAVGQAAYDKSITCADKGITFHLKKPVGDFNHALYMSAFAPYRKDQDKGEASNFSVFSSGPYVLQGAWSKGKGGTFVRNKNWDASTDSVRKALPDSIEITEGLTSEVIAQRLISDEGNDMFAVTDRQVPPSFQQQALSNAELKPRSENVDSPFVDYLTPNFKTMTNPLVRQALAVSTDKTGYITANGGATYGRAAQTLLSPSVLGYKDFNAFSAPDIGDPAKAGVLLKQAGVKTPYPINFTYNGGTPTSKKYAAALKAGWERNGNFKVTLNELTDTYFDVIQDPANAGKYDVTWSVWRADWPSASIVIPPLLDSRVNISAASNGQDYGYYANAELNKKIDEAYATTDLTKQFAMWGDLDEQLAKDVAYIPLAYEKFFFIWGSGVKGWVDNPAFANYPDLGSIGVK